MESVNLSPNGGVCGEFPGGKMEWLVGNRVPEKKTEKQTPKNEGFTSSSSIFE
jgi:hypothetical protein